MQLSLFGSLFSQRDEKGSRRDTRTQNGVFEIRCGKCGKFRPAEKFPKSSKAIYGRTGSCESCRTVVNECESCGKKFKTTIKSRKYCDETSCRSVNMIGKNAGPRTRHEIRNGIMYIECPGCRKLKQKTKFKASKRSPLGVAGHCRDCRGAKPKADYTKIVNGRKECSICHEWKKVGDFRKGNGKPIAACTACVIKGSRTETGCDNCGKKMIAYKIAIQKGNTFCCPNCKKEWIAKNKTGPNSPKYNSVEVACATCGKKMTVQAYRIKRTKRFYCGPGGCKKFPVHTEKERYAMRKTPEYVAWRKSVFARDNHTCQVCNVRGKEFHAHHIYNWKDFPEKRFLVGNGVTLCKNCHNSFHRRYGSRDNTAAQFKEFIPWRRKRLQSRQNQS